MKPPHPVQPPVAIFPPRRRWACLSGILAVTLWAAWLRFWQFPVIPYGLEYDEATKGIDILYMLKTGAVYLFSPSNHGREALFLYPAMLFISLLGVTPFALRLTSVLVSILAVPLLYRLTLTMFWADSRRYWWALMAASGLAMSFWHLGMSRIALRFVLIPPFFMMAAYLFWRGWQAQVKTRPKRAYGYFTGAGVVLGLSQYTYLAARLFPAIFLLVGVSAWLISGDRSKIFWRHGWRNWVVMMAAAVLVFAPLGFVFLNNPAIFSERAGQVNFQVEWTAAGLVALTHHLTQALSLFWGGVDPRIRHHLVERPVFDLLTLLGFWIGVLVSLKQWRKPEYFFLLAGVWLLWLPAPLSVDPIHSPRSSGMLPAFFILAAIGLFQGITWLVGLGDRYFIFTRRSGKVSRLPAGLPVSGFVGLVGLGLVWVSGGLNVYDYFERWANHPLVYQEYKGPSVDLAYHAAALSQTADVILPYEFYAYPPVRFVLRNNFREDLALPFSPFERLAQQPVVYLTPLSGQPSPLFVWLTRDSTGQGVAYLTRFRQQLDPQAGQPVVGRRGTVIGSRLGLDEAMLKQVYGEHPITVTPFIWNDHIHLAGYDLASPAIVAGEANILTFYWEGLKDADLKNKVFIQLVDEQGRPVSQLEEPLVKEDIAYYESRDGFVIQPHRVWTGPDTPAGLYLLRFGLFNPSTGQRAPIITAGNQPVGDQIIGAPFYVLQDGIDPRRPAVPLPARLGGSINLLGYSPQYPLVQPLTTGLKIKLYWQATAPIITDYTVFLQLLDAQNRVISQVDAQPLADLYPTSHWQPGQILVSQLSLPPAPDLLSGKYRLVAGMYDLTTGRRLPVLDVKGQSLTDDMIVLAQQNVP